MSEQTPRSVKGPNRHDIARAQELARGIPRPAMSEQTREPTSELPQRYCRCTSIIGLAHPYCQIHGSQQRQDSLTDQMRSVVQWANERGCYDAADWITNQWEQLMSERRHEITDEMVERLAGFLQSEWAGPYLARVREFMPGPMPPGPERDAALAAMQAADREAEQEARRVARRALEVALGGQR